MLKRLDVRQTTSDGKRLDIRAKQVAGRIHFQASALLLTVVSKTFVSAVAKIRMVTLGQL